MKILIFLSMLAVAMAYTDFDDNTDVGTVEDPVKVKFYLDCVLDKGPCDSNTKIGKTHIKEAIFDGCRECDDQQRHILHAFLLHIRKIYPKDAEEFKRKYDPEGKHFAALEAAINKY